MQVRLIKTSQVVENQSTQKPPQHHFTNWAVQFRTEQASRPAPQVQFRNLFKEEVVQ